MGHTKVWAVASLLAGCASYPQPTDSLANSIGAARGAEEAGAERVPDAALHLRLANEQNEEAKKLMEDGENERAAFLTRRAQSDAELAIALAHEQDAKERLAAVQSEPTQPPMPAQGIAPAQGTTPVQGTTPGTAQ